jgi:hypothetical protein
MKLLNLSGIKWSGRVDLNHRPPGPEPSLGVDAKRPPHERLRSNALIGQLRTVGGNAVRIVVP